VASTATSAAGQCLPTSVATAPMSITSQVGLDGVSTWLGLGLGLRLRLRLGLGLTLTLTLTLTKPADPN
jgi:hypothetical protein